MKEHPLIRLFGAPLSTAPETPRNQQVRCYRRAYLPLWRGRRSATRISVARSIPGCGIARTAARPGGARCRRGARAGAWHPNDSTTSGSIRRDARRRRGRVKRPRESRRPRPISHVAWARDDPERGSDGSESSRAGEELLAHRVAHCRSAFGPRQRSPRRPAPRSMAWRRVEGMAERTPPASPPAHPWTAAHPAGFG
jgi:hypothetical protein